MEAADTGSLSKLMMVNDSCWGRNSRALLSCRRRRNGLRKRSGTARQKRGSRVKCLVHHDHTWAGKLQCADRRGELVGRPRLHDETLTLYTRSWTTRRPLFEHCPRILSNKCQQTCRQGIVKNPTPYSSRVTVTTSSHQEIRTRFIAHRDPLRAQATMTNFFNNEITLPRWGLGVGAGTE